MSRSRSRSPKRRKRSGSRSPYPYSRSPSPDPNDDAGLVTNTFIRAVAGEVKGQDEGYEDNLKRREQHNPKYAFLQRGVCVYLNLLYSILT